MLRTNSHVYIHTLNLKSTSFLKDCISKWFHCFDHQPYEIDLKKQNHEYSEILEMTLIGCTRVCYYGMLTFVKRWQ
jgi:hypothetical protein